MRNVIPIPRFANVEVDAILNLSLLTLIAQTSVGQIVVVPIPTPPTILVAVEPIPQAVIVTPLNVAFGVYVRCSPVLKKWSLMEKTPVTGSNIEESDGSNTFSKIGTPSCFNVNAVLLDLVPLKALNAIKSRDSVEAPYVKSGAVTSIALSV